jgi:hypothetical protein
VLPALHAGLGGHWQVPPVATLAQIWFGSEHPAHAAPPLPHDVGDSLANASQVVPLLQHPLQLELVLQTQCPPEQVVPGAHWVVQLPQWLLSVSVFTQLDPHSVGVGAEHPEVHEYMLPLPEQAGVPPWHVAPQAPQLLAVLICVSHPWSGPPSPQCA